MTTYYVSPTGSDAAAGAIGTPWLTLNHALSVAGTGGHTILLRAGTYGTAYRQGCNTVTIMNYPGEIAVIQRTSTGSCISLDNSKYVTVQNNPSGGLLIARNTIAGNGQSTGLYWSMSGGGTPGFVPTALIAALTIENIPGWAIQIKDTSDAIVEKSDISHCGLGVRFLRVTGASFVQDNTVHHMDRMIVSDATANNDFGGLGIALDDGTDSATVQRNLIYECHAPSVDYGFDGGAVEFYGASNCIVQNNVAYNNEGFLETGTPNATTYPMDGNKIRRNLVYGRLSYDTGAGDTPGILVRAGTNLLIANNTFDVDDGMDIIRVQETVIAGRTAPITNLHIQNNILQSRNTSTKCIVLEHAPMTTTGIVINNNLVRNTTGGGAIVASRAATTYAGTALATWQAASGYGANDVWNSDPLFTNTTVRDYTLQAGSPAIDAGAVITGTTTGYLGAAPDIGFWENAVTPPPGGTTTPPVITIPAADGYNVNGIVTIGGTAPTDSSVELFDGATSKGTQIATGGVFSITLPVVADGVHSYTTKATDAGLSTSAASNTRVITVDTAAPTVSSISPTNGATGIAVATNIVVTFSKPMDPATITTSSFQVTANGFAVAGVITLSAGNTVATFNPSSDLAVGTTYTVTLTSVMRDTAGNAL